MKARGILPRAFIGFLEPRRSTPMIDNPNDAFAQYDAQARLRAELAREVTPLNKAALFAVLQAAGVQRVTVHFDGAGDSGQIESIDVTNQDETAFFNDTATTEIYTPL